MTTPLSSPDAAKAEAAFSRVLASPEFSGNDYVRTWTGHLRFVDFHDGILTLNVRDAFTRDFILDHFREPLVASLERELQTPIQLSWRIDEAYAPPPGLPEPSPASPRQPPLRPVDSGETRRINPAFTFDTFVSAPSNQLAFAGAQAVAREPGTTFSPLFIYGGSGLGKTHLLHAIGNELLRQNPQARIIYRSSEEFTNDYIEAVNRNQMSQFRQRYRNECDCLLVDDVQFFATKEQTQNEFFHTLDAIQILRKPVALTSDTIPSEVKGLPERLRTRFASGLTADIQEPDFETRVAILIKKADSLRLSVPPEVLHYIARTIQRNGRDLQGALNLLCANHSLTLKPITIELAAEVLKKLIPPAKKLDIEQIQRETGRYYKLSLDQLRSPKRTKEISHARHIGMYLARNLTNSAFEAIGASYGGKHYSTVITAVDKVTELLQSDPKIQEEVKYLRTQLEQQSV